MANGPTAVWVTGRPMTLETLSYDWLKKSRQVNRRQKDEQTRSAGSAGTKSRSAFRQAARLGDTFEKPLRMRRDTETFPFKVGPKFRMIGKEVLNRLHGAGAMLVAHRMPVDVRIFYN
jgi:hypothetical protein